MSDINIDNTESVEVSWTEFSTDLEQIKSEVSQIQSGFHELKQIIEESYSPDSMLEDLNARQSFINERERYISEKEEKLIMSISDVEVVHAEIENMEEGI